MQGLAALKGAAPKSDGPSQAIVNREHETMAEAVVGPMLGLTHHGKTTLNQQFLRKPLFVHRLTESIPRCRRIAQPKTPCHLMGNVALATGQARWLGRRIAQQALMKERRGGLMQSIQRAQALLLPLLCTRFRQAHPRARCQEAHCLWKGHVFVLHQKTEDIATGMTAKAIKKPLRG